mgnify:CR=1 FL=1
MECPKCKTKSMKVTRKGLSDSENSKGEYLTFAECKNHDCPNYNKEVPLAD